MAITVAQAVVNSASYTATPVGSVAKTITVSAGSTLVAYVAYGSIGTNGLVAVTDSQSGTWQDRTFSSDRAATQSISKFYRTNVSSGSITVTATFSTTQAFVAIWLVEISGTSGIIDGTNILFQATPGTGTDAITSGTINNSMQPALVLGFSYNPNAGVNCSIGTGFTSDLSDATTVSVIEHQRITTTGATAATFTTSSATDSYITAGFVFAEGTPANGIYVKQEAQNFSDTTTSATTIAVTIQATAGSVIHGWCTADFVSGLTISLSDSSSQSYTVFDVTHESTVENIVMQQFNVLNTVTGALTITATCNNSTTSRGIGIIEIINATATPFDGHTVNEQSTGVTTTDGTTSGTVTPANSPGLVVGLGGFLSGTDTDVGTAPGNAGTGFTSSSYLFQDCMSTFGGLTEHKVVNNTSAVAATFTAATTRGSLSFIAIYDGIPPGPTITVQPAQQRVYAGQTATFNVTATSSGGSLSYQWKLNGSNVGTNSNAYTTGTLLNSDNLDTVDVIVTDSNGSVNSTTVYILVIPTASIMWVT